MGKDAGMWVPRRKPVEQPMFADASGASVVCLQ